MARRWERFAGGGGDESVAGGGESAVRVISPFLSSEGSSAAGCGEAGGEGSCVGASCASGVLATSRRFRAAVRSECVVCRIDRRKGSVTSGCDGA